MGVLQRRSATNRSKRHVFVAAKEVCLMTELCEKLGPHNYLNQDTNLLKCSAVLVGEQVTNLQGGVVPPCFDSITVYHSTRYNIPQALNFQVESHL